MHRCASTTFVVLLVVATSGCALLSPSKESLEKADYGPPPEDYIEKIARYFERRYGTVPPYLDFMGPVKAWRRKGSVLFWTDYRYGWMVIVRTHDGVYRFHFRANAIENVSVSTDSC